jgi:hypothetical protein
MISIYTISTYISRLSKQGLDAILSYMLLLGWGFKYASIVALGDGGVHSYLQYSILITLGGLGSYAKHT